MRRKTISDIRKTFNRFMFSYITILIIILLIGCLAYNATIKIVKGFAVEEFLNTLEKGKDNMEARLKEIETVTLQISKNEKVYGLLNMKKPLMPPEYYKISSAFKELPIYNIKNEFVDDFILFVKDPEIMMTSSYISSGEPSLYGSFLTYDGTEYSQWKDIMLNQYHNRYFLPSLDITNNSRWQREITYIQSLPLGAFNDYKGAIAVFINEERVLNYFSMYQIDKYGWFYIVDRNNNLITSINGNKNETVSHQQIYSTMKGYEEKFINETKVIEYHLTSDYTGWTYVAAIPIEVFLQKTSSIKNLFATSFLLVLLLGLLVSALLSYRNSMPIRDIIRRIRTGMNKNDFAYKNEYDFIEQTVSSLINSNNFMQDELKRNKLLLREGFYARLLRGEFFRMQELESAQAYIDIDISGQDYTVLIMRINGFNDEMSREIFDEIEKARMIARNIFAQRIIQGAGIYNIGADKVALILTFKLGWDNEYVNKIEQELEGIIDELRNKHGVKASFGIGTSYASILDVSISCQEAIKASEYQDSTGTRKVVWYKDIVQSANGLYYPLDLQIKLMNLVRAGEQEDTLKLLQYIMEKNLTERHLSDTNYKQLVYEMRGTLFKIREQILTDSDILSASIDGKILKLEYFEGLDRFFSKVGSIYEDMCKFVREQKKSKSTNLKDHIVEFIHNNYMKSDLSLSTVASEFDLAEKYLSNFFKEKTGENFSTYIEKVRMDHALKLMNQNNKSIGDVAKSVGYISTNTFHKAFKRVYGVSPRTYCSVGVL